MNLQHMRYFLAVARTGGFTPAARAMNVTQPTVSSGIGELERALGVQLFNRDSRHVELTAEGRMLMNYALQIEDLLEEVGEKLQRRALGPGDGFRFGAIDAAVIYLLPEILKAYMREHPGVELSAQVAPSRYLVDDLLMNRSEFALISLPYEHPKIDTISLYRDRMPLVVGCDHRFAGVGKVRLQDVVKEPLLLFHADSVSRKIVDEKLSEAGLQAGAVMEMRSPEAMRKLVEAGVGISFLPEVAIAESVARGDLCTVDVEGVSFGREIGIARRRGRYFGPAIRLLLEQIIDAYGGSRRWLDEAPGKP